MNFPLFIINGFLDAGKSSFIDDTIKNDGFSEQGGTTLLLVCEEGEVEFDDKELSKYKVNIARFDGVEEFTVSKLNELTSKYQPDRIILEANTMWDKEKMRFPQTFKVNQVISFIDFTTFPIYYNNMRQKFVDDLRFSNLVIINRCEDPKELVPYQTSLKLINQDAQYFVMNSEGEANEAFEEPLPYDIDAPIIKIENDYFARWYIDTFDNPDRYEGKKVEFIGRIEKSRKLPKDTFFVGRDAMTCCAADMQYYAHLCTSQLGLKLKNRQWVHLVCEMKYVYSKEYDEDELNLIPISIEVIPPLEDPILDLT